MARSIFLEMRKHGARWFVMTHAWRPSKLSATWISSGGHYGENPALGKSGPGMYSATFEREKQESSSQHHKKHFVACRSVSPEAI
jgi:hypothetical protein